MYSAVQRKRVTFICSEVLKLRIYYGIVIILVDLF